MKRLSLLIILIGAFVANALAQVTVPFNVPTPTWAANYMLAWEQDSDLYVIVEGAEGPGHSVFWLGKLTNGYVVCPYVCYLDMEEFVYPSGQSGIKLEAIENTANILTESEISTVEKVCSLFSNMSAGEISQTSHLEKGWIENKDNRSAISYQDAFALNYG